LVEIAVCHHIDAVADGSPSATVHVLQRRLLAVLFVGLAGAAAELLLIGHYEDPLQWIPLVLLAVAMVATAAMLLSFATPLAMMRRLFQIAMVSLIVSGAVGSVVHYRANLEFKHEMDPSLSGFALFKSVITAKAPPTLAPGTLAVFGLFGLACTVGVRGGSTQS
jgi:hypothetical protein